MKTKSKYFNFNELSQQRGSVSIAEHRGWNGLSITKLKISKGIELWKTFVAYTENDLTGQEKILLLTQGMLEIKSEDYKFSLGQYDAMNFFSRLQDHQMRCLKDSIAFIISVPNDLKLFTAGKPILFNFKKDLESRNLWGNKCISTPYEGHGLTLVLFELKEDFKFEDRGHTNEQITWLISGSMDFYANDEHRTMTSEVGVDIGFNHVHGGVSNGAVGFDAFFPKKQEVKYKTKEIER